MYHRLFGLHINAVSFLRGLDDTRIASYSAFILPRALLEKGNDHQLLILFCEMIFK